MALAPKTVLTYPLDGANRDFVIPFEYLARKFVQVTLVGKDRTLLTLNIDYRFTQRTIITTTKPWGPADGYERIEIRRYTSATERLVDFSDGSILRAYDLNTSQVQSLHIAEEGRDVASDTIGVNNDGDLDARGRKIVNLADAVSDGDAVTLRQEKAWGNSALNQANRSEQQANISSAQALISTQQADLASGRAAAALTSQNAANTSRQQAEAAQINAETARDKAKQWAEANSGIQVEPGLYSAKAWALTSGDYAGQANSSKLAAANSASQAFQDANRSKSEADRAKTEADKLGNANQFMATIETVQGVKTIFKGPHHLYSSLFIQKEGSALGDGQYVSINYSNNGVLYVRNNGGSALTSLTAGGAFAAAGMITSSDGGFTATVTDGSNNSHYWFEGPTGNRGVIYAGNDKSIRFRAGSSHVGLSVTPDGNIATGGSILMNGAIIQANADIFADWIQGGSLGSALRSVKPGTRIKNVPVVIWERGVDTAGGVGDQGAPNSQFVLREPLLPGDFYMFEIYGAVKFYSTTNCIPFSDSTTEEHNVQFDTGGAMLFTLTEGGKRITVRAGKPNNQYGIRRVFLFKLQLA